jgi:hypothetical protein
MRLEIAEFGDAALADLPEPHVTTSRMRQHRCERRADVEELVPIHGTFD